MATVASEVVIDIDADGEEVSVTGAGYAEVSATGEEDTDVSATGEETEMSVKADAQLQLDIEFLNSICDGDDNDSFCDDFQDMDSNFMNIFEFSRSA